MRSHDADLDPADERSRGAVVGLLTLPFRTVGALLGIVTATLASWLIDKVSEESAGDQAETQAEIAALTAVVRRLSEELSAQRSGPS